MSVHPLPHSPGRHPDRRPLLAVLPVLGAATLGSMATLRGVRSSWYRGLRQPSIQPPPSVFRYVWSVLYTMVAGASVAVERRAVESEAARYRRSLARNMAVNTAWTWVFFGAHRSRAGVGVAVALAGDSWVLARHAARTSRGAALALVPYAAWNTFAVLLNARVVADNPQE